MFVVVLFQCFFGVNLLFWLSMNNMVVSCMQVHIIIVLQWDFTVFRAFLTMVTLQYKSCNVLCT